MPAIKCKCGEIIKFGEIPNPNEWLVISDVNFDQFEGKADVEELYSMMKHILECSACGRWWFFKNGFNNAPAVYKEE